jgi:phage-related protein
LFNPIKDGFTNAWNNVKTLYAGIPKWLGDCFATAWTNIQNVFANFPTFFAGLWNKIKNTFSSLGTSIASAISGAVKSGINGVISMIQKTINSAIDIINGAINLINKIPKVNVGKVKHLTLPRMAKGGIVDEPTIAEIGEAGREAVIPLENNKGWIKELASEISNTMAASIKGMEEQNPNRVYASNSLVNDFKLALSEMKVVLDDDELGRFVEKTVSDAIYT